ncbi:Calcineurin-like phosphoesterase [Aspergillus sp. HF37]|nr:Calcineurin-like phosphoesterase [Aspergillus sp. HF37]
MQSGSLQELQDAVAWLRVQPHPTKIVVAGNHGLLLDPSRDDKATGQTAAEREMIDWRDIVYLENAETTVVCANGWHLCIYGSPLSPRHGNWAFQYPRTQDVWAGTVPEGIDVLITHGPPRAHLDLLKMDCVHMLRELWRSRPRLHVFGRVHEGAGTEWLQSSCAILALRVQRHLADQRNRNTYRPENHRLATSYPVKQEDDEY